MSVGSKRIAPNLLEVHKQVDVPQIEYIDIRHAFRGFRVSEFTVFTWVEGLLDLGFRVYHDGLLETSS